MSLTPSPYGFSDPASELSRNGSKSPQNNKVSIAPGLLLVMADTVGSAVDTSADEIMNNDGMEETIPGTKPDGWETVAKWVWSLVTPVHDILR